MSNSIVRMEMSSISTSACCLSFCSQLHFQSKVWTSVHTNSWLTIPQPRKKKQVLCVCEVMRSLCVCFELMQGPQGMRTRPCQTAVWRQQAAGSSLTYSGRRSWDSAVRCFLTSVCGKSMRKPQAFSRSTASSSISITKRAWGKCVHARVHAQKWINKDGYFSFSVPLK